VSSPWNSRRALTQLPCCLMRSGDYLFSSLILISNLVQYKLSSLFLDLFTGLPCHIQPF
jgi:hypothetical protein